MIAVLDFGNSSAKYALCDCDSIYNPLTLISYKPKKMLTFTSILKIVKQLQHDYKNISDIVYSTVNKKFSTELLHDNNNPFAQDKFINIDSSISSLFKINYFPVSSYGQDRLAYCYYCTYCYPDSTTLAIDFGTAITFEYINKKEYNGGAIFPGSQILLNALHTNTSALPKLSSTHENDGLFGLSTKSSIVNASYQYPIAITKYYIDVIIENHGINQLNSVITGGYGEYIYSYFKNNPINKAVFIYDKYAVIKGLIIFYLHRK